MPIISIPQAREGIGFDFRGETRPFDGNECATVMKDGASRADRLPHVCRQILAKGMCGANMRYKTITEKRTRPVFGKIEQLVGQNEMAWGKIITQRSAGTHCHNSADAKGFDGINIGTVIYLGWSENMTDSVASQKSHPFSCQGSNCDGLRWVYQRGYRLQSFLFRLADHIGKAPCLQVLQEPVFLS
jgi:hypothetical protein